MGIEVVEMEVKIVHFAHVEQVILMMELVKIVKNVSILIAIYVLQQITVLDAKHLFRFNWMVLVSALKAKF